VTAGTNPNIGAGGRAVTGDELDTTTTPDTVDKAADNAKSIRVGFNHAEAFPEELDFSTVQASDFRVLVDGVSQTIASVTFSSDLPRDVFINLADSLTSDDTPSVRIIGDVSDVAGNTASVGEVVALDGIAPSLTITVDDSLVQSGDTVKVTVESQEDLDTTVANNPSIDPAPMTGGETNPAAKTGIAVSGKKRFTADFTITSATNGSGYDVAVTATDMAGNAATVTEAALFEVDAMLGAPTATSPVHGTNVEERDPFFISIDWTSEDNEYTGDTNEDVAIVSALLDGSPVSFSTADNEKFILAVSDITLGDHSLKVEAEDTAGNEATLDVDFTVVERAAFEVPLFPGMNLVSLPGAPTETSLSAVLSGTSVDLVVTYDPADPAGPWLIAEKTAGVWTGTVSDIDAMHGYWLRSANFLPISVDIPDVGYSSLLPTVTLVKGWNLVPVLDLQLRDAGTTYTDYFYAAGVVQVAYTYDPTTNSWTATTDDAIIGNGYWAYASGPGAIIP
jgi:hypothetical protein